MATPEPNLPELVEQLIVICEDRLSGRQDILTAAYRLRRSPLIQRIEKADPVKDAVCALLATCKVDADGVVTIDGEALTVGVIAGRLGRTDKHSSSVRIGRLLSALGYTKVQRTKTHPSTRYIAPRHLW